MPISTCAITSKRIGQSSCWKQMTIIRVINAQHPKNARAIVQKGGQTRLKKHEKWPDDKLGDQWPLS
jgi:hypothetical protein